MAQILSELIIKLITSASLFFPKVFFNGLIYQIEPIKKQAQEECYVLALYF